MSSLPHPPEPPTPAPPASRAKPSSCFARVGLPTRPPTWLLALLGLVPRPLTPPLSWGSAEPGACSVPAGLALALVVWLGPWAVVVVLAQAVLAALQG